MQIKINHKEIFPLAKDTGNVFKDIQGKMGGRNPFARFDKGAGFYVWTLPGDDWTPLSKADSDEAVVVRDLLLARRDEVRALTGSDKTTDILFTVPSDDYILYRNDDNGGVQVILAAWSFRWPARTDSRKKDQADVVKANPVAVEILFDDVSQPGRVFSLRNPGGKWIAHTTDADGRYAFKSLQPGREVTLRDDKTGKEFTFVVEAGKSLYQFDVTTYVDLRVTVTDDGLPKGDESVKATFRGRTLEGVTLPNGEALFSLPLYEGEPFTATVRDLTKSGTLDAAGNILEFVFEIPKPEPIVDPEPPQPPIDPEPPLPPVDPEPPLPPVDPDPPLPPVDPEPPIEEPEPVVVTVLDKEGKPMAGAAVKISQDGTTLLDMRTDKDGKIQLDYGYFDFQKPAAVDIRTAVTEYEGIPLTFDEGEHEYVLQAAEKTVGSPWKQWLVLAGVAAFCAVLWFFLSATIDGLREGIFS